MIPTTRLIPKLLDAQSPTSSYPCMRTSPESTGEPKRTRGSGPANAAYAMCGLSASLSQARVLIGSSRNPKPRTEGVRTNISRSTVTSHKRSRKSGAHIRRSSVGEKERSRCLLRSMCSATSDPYPTTPKRAARKAVSHHHAFRNVLGIILPSVRHDDPTFGCNGR